MHKYTSVVVIADGQANSVDVVDICYTKQKTANVMLMSDWSSDVCSSDHNGSITGPVAPTPLMDQIPPFMSCESDRCPLIIPPPIMPIIPPWNATSWRSARSSEGSGIVLGANLTGGVLSASRLSGGASP